jgi:multimeric flavodoxin WrbA
MTKILAINGSYRDDGMTVQAVDALVQAATENGASVEVILLRDYPIEFCLNCRECTQQPGTQPGHCVQQDGMQELVAKIEAADAYILASPTNVGSVTALFKRFMERLAVYAYWPWGAHAPDYRKAGTKQKKAVLIASSAAPGYIARWVFDTVKQLKVTATTIGAKPVGVLFTGQASGTPHPELPGSSQRKAKKLAEKLLAED